MDDECKIVKGRVLDVLKVCKVDNFSENTRKCYYIVKKDFQKILNQKKKEYYDSRIEIVNNCKNATAFWRVINLFRGRVRNCSQISKDVWFDFLQRSYPDTACTPMFPLFLPKISVPTLDDPLSTEEIIKCLLKCPWPGWYKLRIF